MNRTIGGIPLLYWIGALGLGIGAFAWIKKKGAASNASPATAKAGAPTAFTQAQEVQDFQIFSALTSAQQGSDLNFLSEVAGLFAGGSSTGTSGGTGSTGGGASAPPTTVAPAPPSTGTTPPATTPASSATYLNQATGATTTFGSPPPPGFGYSYNATTGQWGLTPGTGIGYVAA
jgi:hypothetical protein